MIEHALRLTNGDDIKLSIQNYCLENGIDTAVILSSVGCIRKLSLRLAGAIDTLEDERDYEILGINGTISKGKAHLHGSFGDSKGIVSGGHLLNGCIVNTTCELVIAELESYRSERVFDKSTGYNEIIFERINDESDY